MVVGVKAIYGCVGQSDLWGNGKNGSQKYDFMYGGCYENDILLYGWSQNAILLYEGLENAISLWIGSKKYHFIIWGSPENAIFYGRDVENSKNKTPLQNFKWKSSEQIFQFFF